MPQSAALKAQFEEQFRPQLALAHRRMFERLGPSAPQVEATFAAFLREMDETAAAEGAAVQVPIGGASAWDINRILDGALALQPVVDSLVEDLDTAMGRAQLRNEAELYVAAFPTGSYNAIARPFESGVLILINNGLMMMAHQVSKILAFAIRFHDETPDGVVIEHPDMGRPTHTLEEISTALAEVFIAYEFFNDPTYARRFPALGGIRGFVAAGVRDVIELFVIAHEVGHVLAGHLDDDGRSPADELAADDLALQLLMHHREIDNPAVRMIIASGPLLFFVLAELLDDITAALAGPPPSELVTHPRSSQRLARCRETLEAGLGPPSVEMADTMVTWLKGHSSMIVDATVDAATPPEGVPSQ